MVAAFLIFFRESFEASMIMAIMFAYLKKIGRQDRFRDVWIGVAAALALAAAGGILVFFTIRVYDGSFLQTVFESFTYAVAAVILTYMTFWMKRQSRDLKGHLQAKMDAALNGGAVFSLALTAFVTVLREGLETVVFLVAIAFGTNPQMLAFGAGFGLAAGLSLSYAVYIAGSQIRLGRFFDVMGVLLMLFAAGLFANAIEDWQSLGWLPFADRPLWNTGRILNENGTAGDILHSFFGYASTPTALQLTVYIGYIAIMGYYLRRRKDQRTAE